MNGTQGASVIQLIGAGAFGVVIGWYVYYVNRYRTGDVQMSDITTLIGAIGGGAILAIFKAGTDLFGAYGIGLAVGFFAYFAALLLMVNRSEDVFKVTWFLDGRRKKPEKDEEIQPGRPPMKASGPGPNV
jgi:hypothetical protein